MKKKGQILILLTPIISFLLLVFFRESVLLFDNIQNGGGFFMAPGKFIDFIRPYYAYIFIVLIVSLYIFTAYNFSKESIIHKWWNYSILPSCFTMSIISFVVLIPNVFFVRSLFVLSSLFVYLYFRTIYGIINFDDNNDGYALENLSSYGNFLAVYFFGASLYGLQSFLNTPISFLMLLFAIFISFVVYQVIWANGINIKESIIFLLVICLVLLQLAWSISFLTLSYYMLGLILAIYYYILIGVVRFYLLGNLDKSIVKLYIIFGSLSMLSVLLTATWL